MKQTALMFMLLIVGTGGPILYGPFIGVAVYYLFAVLRPHYLWDWALAVDLRWSLYVAIATLMSVFIYRSTGALRGARFTLIDGFMVAFAFCITLSHLFALNTEVSWTWYWDYLKIFIMFFCSSFAVRELAHVRILYLIAVVAIGYIAYEVNFLYVFSHRLDIYHMGYGGLDNNGAALQIAMAIPMAYFLWQGGRRWWRWIFFLMLPIMLHAVLMSYSRGAMLSLLLAAPVIVLRSRNKKQLVLFLACFLTLVPILAGEEIRARFFSIETYEQDSGAQSRFGSWRAAWNIAKDHPLLGVGIRNADLLSYQYGADMEGRAIHSQYLQILADSGFPALAFYVLLLCSAWKGLRRVQKYFRQSQSDEDRLAYNLAAGLEAAIVVFMIGSLFLSLELFEFSYLLILLAMKLRMTVPQEETARASVSVVPRFVT
jgi:probable O-glycosylation ligase (exosortase A-associated)